jgi:hypothetical protein
MSDDVSSIDFSFFILPAMMARESVDEERVVGCRY